VIAGRAGTGEKGDVMAKDKKASATPADSKQVTPGVRWLDDVAEHDFAAAEAYLSLRLEPAQGGLRGEAQPYSRRDVA
jgi:hypothetical protein